MDSYIQSYDPDWYGVINSNDAGNSKEKIFILGSSNVYSINATKINEQLTNQEKNFLVYNLADMGDTPAKRISSIDNIISHKPKLVLYGIGLWEFEKFTPVSYSVIDFLVEPSKFFIFLFEDSTNSSIREYIPGSPKDRSLLSLNHILRGPDPHFHPFIKFYPTPINNLEKLEQNFDLPTYNGLELTNKNKKIVALNKMLKKFKTVVCHGMLLASFFSRLVGMYLPGKDSLYFSQSLNFLKPAFVDDIVTVSGKVISKSISTKIITLNMTIKNLENELLSGEAKVFMNGSNYQIS